MIPTLRGMSECREDETQAQIIENKVVFEKYPKNGTK